MSYANFVHLHVHTAYSLTEGAISTKKLGKICKGMGMPAVAMTDTRNMFAALEFSTYVSAEGVQPIIGCQISVRRQDDGEESKGFGSRDVRPPEPDNLVLLSQSQDGYRNLMKMVSKAYMIGDGTETPQIDWDELASHTEGLICLTGGVVGPVGRLLLEGRKDAARETLVALAKLFPDCLYVELQRHDLAIEDQIEEDMIGLAYELNLPLVATNDCYYPDADMYEAHDVLICMAQKATLSQNDRRRLTPYHYFRSPEEMIELFKDIPEAIENTVKIAQRCHFIVQKVAPLLPRSARAADASEEDVLRQMAVDGLKKRLEDHVFTPDMDEAKREEVAKRYWDRLEYEMGIIVQMGFPGYFIIVADFIQWGKDHDIPVGPGRGSGAGSVVAWALTITDLDPLHFNLLFERFLNPERVSMPDFDVDFCQERREEVIHYVQRAYGFDHVAQIITFGKLQARAVLRSVGRVLEMPLGYVDKICKMVPNNPAAPISLPEAIEQEPQLQALRDSDPNVAQLLAIGQRLEGLYSHASTHAAGVVIGDRPLDELVALYRDPSSDMPVTQFNMKWVESSGLIKFDFLGLKTLSVLQYAVKLLRLRDIDITLNTIPLDDKKTYEMLARGDTAGVFQLESQGMRDVLTKLKPDCLEDIVAVVALYRPGPMDNIPSYIARKKGEEEVDYMHPDLEPILKETYGIMIYQEQVMQAAQAMAGYSLGGADLLRRAMGKKIKEEMDRQRLMFEDGCEARGTSRQRASEIFDTIAKFAGYGFNKSHAAAYGFVAYQTAYLKANYPVEFMAAIMTYDLQNTDKLAGFKAELQRLEIPLLPPDVNYSQVRFFTEFNEAHPTGAVRYALAAVKGVGEAAMHTVVKEREKSGKFKSLQDFAQRLDPRSVNKRLLENLTRAGAFDTLNSDRAEVFGGIETIMKYAHAAAEERASSQTSLFGGSDSAPPFNLPRLDRPWSKTEMLNEERAAIGFFLSAHPLDSYAKTLERLSVVSSNHLLDYIKNGGQSPVKMAAIVGSRKEKIGKNGSRYAFVTLSDAGGAFEVMFFSEVLAASRELLDSGQPVLISVDARLDGEQLRLGAQHLESLDSAVSKATKKVMVYFSDERAIPGLKHIISQDGRGHGRIVLVARTKSQEVELQLNEGFQLSGATIGALKGAPGVLDVREI